MARGEKVLDAGSMEPTACLLSSPVLWDWLART